MRPSRRVTAMLAAALVLGGCTSDAGDESPGGEAASPDGGATTTEPTAAPSPSPSASPSEPSGAGELLSVSGRSLDGGQFSFADAAGDRLVLWMWAPW